MTSDIMELAHICHRIADMLGVVNADEMKIEFKHDGKTVKVSVTIERPEDEVTEDETV